MPLSEQQQIKQREHDTWAAVADGWRRQDDVLKRGGAGVSAAMIRCAGIGSGMEVLDIASGTGEPALAIAAAVGDTGSVIGTDLVDDMLQHARDKAQCAQLLNVTFQCVDGELLDFEPESFDAATVRWGLMFMPQPEHCVRAVYRTLRSGAKLAVACWAQAERNPAFTLMTETMTDFADIPPPPPDAPGMFSLSDPDKLTAVIEAGGFTEVTLEAHEVFMIPSQTGRQYWETISDLAGPIARLYRSLDESTQHAFIEAFSARLEGYKTNGTIKVPAVTWIAAGIRGK